MKMKRIFTVLLLVCIATGAAYAQADESKNSITIDFFPLMKGFVAWDSDADITCFFLSAGIDHLIAPSHTIGAIVDLYFANISDTPCVYFGGSFAYKYWAMSTKPEKVYIGAQAGFNILSVDGKTDSKYGGFMGLTTGLSIGYRILLTDKLFLEPSMSYILAKSAELTPLGWQGGLKLGFNL